MHSLLEWQGRPHPVTYSMRAPRPDFRMGTVVDPKTERLIAYTITGLFGRADRTIWLDGRPHPSKYAEHLWQGFSTGEWVDGGLKVTTTHIKYSFVHRNGIPLSPYAVMTEYYWRHGDFLTLAIIVEDPIYLTEPLVRTATFKRDPNLTIPALQPFEVAEELPSLEKGQVPAYPLGTTHPEYATRHNLPFEASQGGAADDVPGVHEASGGTDESACANVNIRHAAMTLPAAARLLPALGAVLLARWATSLRSKSSSGQARLTTMAMWKRCRCRATCTSSPDRARTSRCRSIPDGVLVVDSSVAAMSEKVIAAIRTISDKPSARSSTRVLTKPTRAGTRACRTPAAT